MNTRIKTKKTATKQAGPRNAHKLVNQAEEYLRNTESQVITPKKREIWYVNSCIQDAFTKTAAQKAGISKSMSVINISDVRKKKSLSGAAAKSYLRYLKEIGP